MDKALYHGVFNRFRADIRADDLDEALKASRETFEESPLIKNFKSLLREIFNEANNRYENATKAPTSKKPSEGQKEIVAPRLVEYPVADALVVQSTANEGTEADESWFYLEIKDNVDIKELIKRLYTEQRGKYKYQYIQNGATSRLVQFNPDTSVFWINQDHELVREYYEGQSRILLEDFVTAEALLEVYLREAQLPAHIIGDVLERRDGLLRSLAKDHAFSLKAIASQLRSAAAEERELEVLLVVAARALGFVASHISNAGKPDGLARFTDYPQGEKKITLEAKSSRDVPSLPAIGFDALAEHVKTAECDGCLLLAPSYPGGKNATDDEAAANRARQQRISCWTVEQLARFIEVAEARQLNARHLLDIVLNYFSPKEVSAAIDELLESKTIDVQAYYLGVLKSLRQLEYTFPDSQRTVDLIAGRMAADASLNPTNRNNVVVAIRELANASQGGMQLRGENVIISVSLDELERRVGGITKQSGEPRRVSNFRE